MPTTYEPIATTTLSSAAASITFSSISSAYTDLRVVFVVNASTTGVYADFLLNNDSGTNYSNTRVYGNGTSALSASSTNATRILPLGLGGISNASNEFNLLTLDLFSYAGSTYKTCLTTSQSDKNGSGYVERTVALWRSTSAVNRIDINATSGNFSVGTTATLYGIKNA